MVLGFSAKSASFVRAAGMARNMPHTPVEFVFAMRLAASCFPAFVPFCSIRSLFALIRHRPANVLTHQKESKTEPNWTNNQPTHTQKNTDTDKTHPPSATKTIHVHTTSPPRQQLQQLNNVSKNIISLCVCLKNCFIFFAPPETRVMQTASRRSGYITGILAFIRSQNRVVYALNFCVLCSPRDVDSNCWYCPIQTAMCCEEGNNSAACIKWCAKCVYWLLRRVQALWRRR